MDVDSIDKRLLDDCHVLGAVPSGMLLLNRNASLHWFILVPQSKLYDVLDLPLNQAQLVFTDCAAISAYMKEELSYPKINFAGLGNQVPQMHLHIVGRHVGDVCWPDPIWGNIHHSSIYTNDKVRTIQEGLVKSVGLVVGAA
ncbi:MAG: HIT domain-containing protein [Halioglobus sp.]